VIQRAGTAIWRIAIIHVEWHALDAVNVVLECLFEKANFEMPYKIYYLRVHIEMKATRFASR